MYFDRIKKFLKKLNYKSYIFFYILMNTIMPLVAVLTSKLLTTYTFMVVALISVLFTFFACRLTNIKEYAFLLVPFIIYELLDMFVENNANITLAGYQILLFMLPICIGYYIIHKRDIESGIFSVVLTSIFVITAITTIIGCIRYPEAARELATTKTSQDSTAIFYGLNNIGGYGFVYSLVLLYPAVILAFKMKKLNIFVTIGFVILTFALAITAEYTYALLLLLITSLLFFVRLNISLSRFIFLLILFFVGALVFKSLIGNILLKIGNMIGNDTMTAKMTVVFLGEEVVGNVDDSRDALYMFSINKFLENPLLGTFVNGYTVTGGHSFILDNLSLYGLLGGALMFLMYRGIFKVFYKPYIDRPGRGIVFWLFLQPIVLSAINTGMWEWNLCLYAPLILYYIYGEYPQHETPLDCKSVIRPLVPKTEQ